MDSRICIACGSLFQPLRNPSQTYCSAPNCQRERRRLWQKAKLQTDPDYRDNQQRAQQAWIERNTGYWREYRNANPDQKVKNRASQSKRNARRKSTMIAKMDPLIAINTPFSGRYRLIPITDTPIAKMDAWIVDITVLSIDIPSHVSDCKEMT